MICRFRKPSLPPAAKEGQGLLLGEIRIGRLVLDSSPPPRFFLCIRLLDPLAKLSCPSPKKNSSLISLKYFIVSDFLRNPCNEKGKAGCGGDGLFFRFVEGGSGPQLDLLIAFVVNKSSLKNCISGCFGGLFLEYTWYKITRIMEDQPKSW